MKRLLQATTAAGLVFSLFSINYMTDAHADNQMLPASRYAARAHAQPSQLRAKPVMAAAQPKPIQIASTQWMATPTSSSTMPSSDGALVPQALIPVLPRASFGPRPMLYPSKIGSPTRPEVLPLPEGQVAVPAPVPAQVDASGAAYTTAMPASDMPAILPLPDAMSANGAPQFKPYATIETQTGSLPPREIMRTQAIKQINEMEAMIGDTPQPIPALPPMASDEASASPMSQEASVPEVLPLPEEMAAQAASPEKKQFLRDTGQQQAPAAGRGLSDDTKRVLGMIPSGVDAPHDRGGKLAVKRYNPEVEGVLNKKDDSGEDGEVASVDKNGVRIAVRRPSVDADYELQQAYDSLSAGDVGGALESYNLVVAAYPQNQQALFGLAATYHQMGEVDKARSYYKRLLAIDPDNRDALNNFLVLVSDESPEDALHQLQMLERRNPNFSPIPAQMAIIYSKMGNMDAAQRKMAQAVQLAPGNLAYQYNLAVIMDKQGNFDRAASLYRGLIQAYQRGEEVPAEMDEIQERLVYIDQVHTN